MPKNVERECDECGGDIGAYAERYACVGCEYDLCVDCFMSEAGDHEHELEHYQGTTICASALLVCD